MDRQRVLITGGAGFLGINLTRHLLSRGYAVVSLDVEEFDYPERDRVEIIKGDIRNKALVDRAVEGADFVVHTAAALPLYSPEDIYTTDVEGTRNVLDASLRHGVERFVHVSSTAVYGIPDHHPLYETDRLEGVGPYRPDHPPQVVYRAGASRRVRAALRLGLHGTQLPHDRLGEQPLPAARRRRPLRRDNPDHDPPQGAGQRHLQHRRQRVYDDEGRLSGGPGLRGPRQEGGRLPCGAGHLGPAHPRPAEAFAAIQMGLRDGLQGLLRLHREGPETARLRAQVLQQGGPDPELPLVPR